jgi:hypothetical protein
MHSFGVVHKDHERGRFDRYLRNIIILHPFGPVKGRLVACGEMLKCPVELGGGRSFPALFNNLVDLLKNLGYPLAGLG